MCRACEEIVKRHPTRRGSNNGNGYCTYTPKAVPDVWKKDTLKAAIDDHFNRFLDGEDESRKYLVEIIAIVKTLMIQGKWKHFEVTTTSDDGIQRKGDYAYIKVYHTGEIEFIIRIQRWKNIVIDAGYNPVSCTRECQRLKNLWHEIVSI